MAVIVKTPGPAEDFHSGWSEIIDGQIIRVKERKQMRISGPITITGIVILDGTVVLD